ncbi:MAG: zinc ABC transporter substrate-binding protein [Phormidesmis sp. CAN_BIN44]|nr:zinc ABC transporter substrate-binding protein [Phormidesmis sp. CAN_BIN44]
MVSFVRQSCLAVIALSIAGLTGCSAPSANQVSPSASSVATPTIASDAPKVVATNSVLCDLAKQIAVDTINLTCLIKPGTDAHVYQATPDDRKAIETANLVLYGGYNFEPSLTKLIQAGSNATKVAVHEVAVPTPQMFEEDGKTEPDPHVWHNAQNGVQITQVIQTNLAKVSPTNADLYAKNAGAIAAQLTQIDSWIKSQIATIPPATRKLVTTHDALGYYAEAYNVPVEGALEGISTEEKPTAARVKELVTTIVAAKVPTIFAEVSINPQLIETVAKEANVKVSDQELFTDGLGEPGSSGETYQKMLTANTKAIVEGLGGKFTAFQAK